MIHCRARQSKRRCAACSIAGKISRPVHNHVQWASLAECGMHYVIGLIQLSSKAEVVGAHLVGATSLASLASC